MARRICFALAWIALAVGVGYTLLPMQDPDCGIAWAAAFDDDWGCDDEGQQRLLTAAVGVGVVAFSALVVAHTVFRRDNNDWR